MILRDEAEGIRTLTIDRVDKANSLTGEMLAALIDGLSDAGGLRMLILTGAGDKVFSAGADLEAAKAGLATSPLWEELSGKVATCPCLTVAALNGTLAGGAFGMALACDLRLSVAHASFFYPVARLGFLPQQSDPVRMERLIGPARTKLILTAGARLDAAEALHFGLIDRIVPDPGIAAKEMAEALKDSDPAHLAAIKAMVPG